MELDWGSIATALIHSHVVHAALALGLLLLIALRFGRYSSKYPLHGFSMRQRFERYTAYYEKRHAVWCGDEPPRPRAARLRAALVSSHSLLRLWLARGEWRPHSPVGLVQCVTVMLCLLQCKLALTLGLFVPPITKALGHASADAADGGGGDGGGGGGGGGSAAPFPIVPTILAAVVGSLLHTPLRILLDRLYRWRAHTMDHRPDPYGWTEGHVVARAALVSPVP